ncbi:hypothetical protein LO80_01435 [Candidatus Francisella endociliophora]|uniref:Alpha/beta hydrolase n=1 Tax=Candidatus Francisella endociliophora TaxID=653937 RepID=A0A097EMH1_9GAMM|nr:alpha/beta hydrolase [Francisella sp. FSC1006]AIT08767.1 hypothetical protein LO80_01435 [Francisella sp. FSC1006]
MNQSDNHKQQLEIHISQLACLYYLYTLSHLFKHHQNTISLKPENWQKIKDKQDNTETINTVETTINHLVINVFEPPMMINLREDYYFAYYKHHIQRLVRKNFKTDADYIGFIGGKTLDQLDTGELDNIKQSDKLKIESYQQEYSKLIQRYKALLPFFDDPKEFKPQIFYTALNDGWSEFTWDDYLIALAKSQHKLLTRQEPGTDIKPNLTFFIHGYNVPVEQKGDKAGSFVGYPQALEYADSQYDVTSNKVIYDYDWYDPRYWYKDNILKMKDQKASILPTDEDSIQYNEERNPTDGASGWNLIMEASLNKAADWDEKDLNKYNRIVQVAWQGNPASDADYIAAVPMSEFAGEQLAQLVDKLQGEGIEVNIMAHSLGNAVIMNTLKNVGQPINRAICWEPAIANNCFDNDDSNTKRVQKFGNKYIEIKHVEKNGKDSLNAELVSYNQNYNISYNYAAAKDKAEKFTIAYSNCDNILGPVPYVPNLFDKNEDISKLTNADIANRLAPYVINSMYVGILGTINDKLGTDIRALGNSGDIVRQISSLKTNDKSAGAAFGIISTMVYALESLADNALGQDYKVLNSIYSLANRFVYPFNYFLEGNIEKRFNDFYKQWAAQYDNFYYNNKDWDISADWEEQRDNLIDAMAKGSNTNNNIYTVFERLIDYVYSFAGGYTYKDMPKNILDNTLETVNGIYNVGSNLTKTMADTVTLDFENAQKQLTESFWNSLGVGFSASSIVSGPVIKEVSSSIKSYFAGNKTVIDELHKHKKLVVTTMLTVLLTKEARPADALGYDGASKKIVDEMGGKLSQTDQSIETAKLDDKAKYKYPCLYIDENNDPQLVTYSQLLKLPEALQVTSKSLLCVDHSAMKIPSKEMMDYVYKGYLLSGGDGSLKYFGNYKIG